MCIVYDLNTDAETTEEKVQMANVNKTISVRIYFDSGDVYVMLLCLCLYRHRLRIKIKTKQSARVQLSSLFITLSSLIRTQGEPIIV